MCELLGNQINKHTAVLKILFYVIYIKCELKNQKNSFRMNNNKIIKYNIYTIKQFDNIDMAKGYKITVQN